MIKKTWINVSTLSTEKSNMTKASDTAGMKAALGNSQCQHQIQQEQKHQQDTLNAKNMHGWLPPVVQRGSKLPWWGGIPVTTDWTTTCTESWRWCPFQLAHVVNKTKPQSVHSNGAPLTRQQAKMWGWPTCRWQPKSMAAVELERTATFTTRTELTV